VFITQHWLLLVNVGLFVFIALPFLAPVLMAAGYTGPANVIYTTYHLTCHQLAYRTFFLFGAQPDYTVMQLQQALGESTPALDLFFWGGFRGDTLLGYKMAYCERDAAIYTSIFLASLLFALVRRRLKPLDWRLYFLFAVLPMGIDGTWQLFTSPYNFLSFLPTHESTALLRTITGTLFGVGTVWLIFPYLEAAMRETYEQARDQYARAVLRRREEASG
jgi:uncharacterized membrane protein